MITQSAVRGTSSIRSLSCVPRSATALPGRFRALGGVGAHFGAPQSAKPTRGAARLRRAVSERGGLGGPFGAPHSFVAQDQPGVSRRLVDRHAGGPVRAELRGNAEPAHPLLAHRRRLVGDRKSTRLNSSHVAISYAVFCLKKKNDGLCRLLRARV